MYRLFGALLVLLLLCNFKPVLLRKISHQDCLPGLQENEFAFGGSGYVALENRGNKPRKFSHIKLSFKTSADEGLMYFTGTPKGHFESLELNHGKVIYQFELSSGRVKMASDKRYNDGKWHVLEAKWMQEDSSLVIDDSFESVARSPGCFKSLSFTNAAYFGGFKGQHNIEGVTEKGFNGSVKDVQLEGTSRRLSMHTEMRNAHSGCRRRWRRQVESDSGTRLYTSYTGSTVVELRWSTSSCYDDLVIQWQKLEETDVSNKSVTDYFIEIDELEPNTTYMFTLKGRINQNEQTLKINHTTLEDSHPSLIVNSVSNSSLFVSWKSSENFVVSLSGNSQNVTVTNGVNHTFEDLTPGKPYKLSLTDNNNGHTTQREVVTIPNPVLVQAYPSTDEINLTWVNTAEIEVVYKISESVCKLERLSGTYGKISHLGSGCKYQLNVYAVSSGRRSGSSQTIDVETSAFSLENFTCSTGDEAGDIHCNWSHIQRSQEPSCLKYTLNFSSSQDFATKTALTTRKTFKLTPGGRYSISILSETSSGITGNSLATNATAKPGIDDKFFESQSASTNDTISVHYSKDSRRVIDYYNVSSNGTPYFLNDSVITASFGSLEAGHCYNFTAFAVSQDEQSKMLDDIICTVPNSPSFQCHHKTNRSLELAIHKPKAGLVDSYDIKAIMKSGPNTEPEEAKANAETVFHNISSLRPYTEYDIIVTSVVKNHHHEKKSSPVTLTCKTAEGIPSHIQNLHNTTYQSDKVTVAWHKPEPENGEIRSYFIRVGQTGKTTKIFVADGRETEYSLTYPEVLAGETYNISISAVTSAGEGGITSKYFTLKDEPVNTLFVMLAILLAILFAVLIGLLAYYYIRNSPQRMQSFRRMSNRLRNPSEQIAMVFPQPSVTSKPIQFSQFLEHIKFLEKDSGLKFSEEYEDLKYVGRNQSREEAELQCNRVKNRFTNILPYDISRVKLLPMDDEDGSDYINASWIPGFHSKREFIASQGPLPSTVNDFWRMVWENNCQAIVMLTLCMEKGHIKCEQYWPMDKEPVFYGDLKVEILNETKTDEWCILEFKISLGAQSRELKHFHYTGWPDMYVPEKMSLIAFVHMVRDSINKSNKQGPVVVHCSAGVGRTGTFIALDTLLLHVQERHDLDVYGIVFQMRMNRVLMVQTEAQYVFIYECLHEVLEGPRGPAEKTKEAAPEGDMKDDSKTEPIKTELEPKPNSDSKEEPSNKEKESDPKHSDSINSDSKEELSKKESDPKHNCDSSENKCNDYTATNSGAESQKDNAKPKEEGTSE